jgi:hypothetical protein
MRCDRKEHTSYILHTDATFHFEMSLLNDGWINILAMLVTAAVFQSAIGPYVVVAAVGSLTHAITAVFKFVSVMAVCAATCAGSARSSARPARRCDRLARAQLHRSDTLQLRVASSCN